jgi:glycosyltransferase involved in cell wall biosynthesis
VKDPQPSHMRVLHVLWSGGLGGIERVVFNLAAEQLARGEILPAVMFAASGGPFAEAVRSRKIESLELGMTSGFLASPRALVRARRIATRCDVIHLHSFIPALTVPLVLSGRPIVFSEHGVFGQGRKVTLADRLRQPLKGRFLRTSVVAIAANSRFTARKAIDRYRLPESALDVVYNGISLEQFPTSDSRRPHGDSGDVFTVGFVGRLAGAKHLERLLHAVALVDSSVLRVLIVGGGPQKEELQRLTSLLKLAEKVEFVGPVTDVSPYFARMDLFVLPSRDETFGMVLVEAVAAGIPAVVFADAGGPVEILDQLGCGSIVKDEAELAEVIRKATHLGVLPTTCTSSLIATNFTIAAMAQQFRGLYKRATSGAHGDSRT